MWKEDIPLCSTVNCNFNDEGECIIDPKNCPYLKLDNQDMKPHEDNFFEVGNAVTLRD